jgi:hypothetical protein
MNKSSLVEQIKLNQINKLDISSEYHLMEFVCLEELNLLVLHNTLVTQLRLEDDDIGAEGVEHIVQLLYRNSHILEIELWSNSIGAQAIAEALKGQFDAESDLPRRL